MPWSCILIELYSAWILIIKTLEFCYIIFVKIFHPRVYTRLKSSRPFRMSLHPDVVSRYEAVGLLLSHPVISSVGGVRVAWSHSVQIGTKLDCSTCWRAWGLLFCSWFLTIRNSEGHWISTRIRCIHVMLHYESQVKGNWNLGLSHDDL